MAEPLYIWFPEISTEAHRDTWRGAQLVVELAKLGIYCRARYDSDCRLAFVASFSTFLEAANGYTIHPNSHEVPGYRSIPELPIVQFCWDLYPFKVEAQDDPDRERWQAYIEELKYARCILVPSRCTVERVRQYTGQSAFVVRSSVGLWEPPDGKVWDGGYVVDVMRYYPGDPNANLCEEVCAELDIPCIVPRHNYSWKEFKRVIAGARLLVSATYEASTGGLTMLEGFAMGKPSLVSDSPMHGGIDYMGCCATYFKWDSREDFKCKLIELYNRPPQLAVETCRRWVEAEFSDAVFAKNLATYFRQVAQ